MKALLGSIGIVPINNHATRLPDNPICQQSQGNKKYQNKSGSCQLGSQVHQASTGSLSRPISIFVFSGFVFTAKAGQRRNDAAKAATSGESRIQPDSKLPMNKE